MKLFQVLEIRALEKRERKQRVFRYVTLGETSEEAIRRVRVDNECAGKIADWEAYEIKGGVFGMGVYFHEVKKR